MTARRGRSRRATDGRRCLWLVPAAFLLHCAEELPTFPDWATRHFGTTTTRFYLASHAVLVPSIFALIRRGADPSATRAAARDAAAIPCALLANTAFHVASTRRFGEYSPGVVTAVTLVGPASAHSLRRLVGAGTVSAHDLAFAGVLGLALNGAAVASLRLDAPRLGG